VTDVEMPPGPSGLELAAEIRERWPFVQVLVTSGRVFPASLPEGVVFLPKPWTAECLARSVNEAVERIGRCA
jgi:FixJ family two-component response regulator